MNARVARGWARLVLAAALSISVAPAAALGQGPAGLFDFQPGQLIRLNVVQVDGGEETSGYLQVQVATAGGGQVQLTIDAEVGANSCHTTTTVASGASAAGQMMVSCMPLMPVTAALFTPTWAMFLGQSLTVGNSWSMGSAGNQTSFAVTENCTYAGVTGVRVVMAENGEERINSCFDPSVPLPLYVKYTTDDGYVELEATKIEGV